jgi:hypothetical protein
MKKNIILAALLSLVSLSALALDATGEKMQKCGVFGMLYQQSAMLRELSDTPQQAVDQLSSAGNRYFKRSQIVTIVNRVYFDPAFTYAGGDALYTQMYEYCMRDGRPKYVPAK